MLDKIVEILLNKYLRLHTPEQKAEQDIKEKIVFLHETLVRCQNAYLQHKSNPSYENLLIWHQSFLHLYEVLYEIRTTLATFAQDIYDHVLTYMITEQTHVSTWMSLEEYDGYFEETLNHYLALSGEHNDAYKEVKRQIEQKRELIRVLKEIEKTSYQENDEPGSKQRYETVNNEDFMLLTGLDIEEDQEFKREIDKLNSLRGDQPQDTEPDFVAATLKLREFMGKNMTMGEIHKAQKVFEKRFLP